MASPQNRDIDCYNTIVLTYRTSAYLFGALHPERCFVSRSLFCQTVSKPPYLLLNKSGRASHALQGGGGSDSHGLMGVSIRVSRAVDPGMILEVSAILATKGWRENIAFLSNQ